MRKLRLKEKDTDRFLQLEDTGKGGLLLIEESGTIMAQVSLSLKQLGQIRDWNKGVSDDFFKKNRMTVGRKK